MAESKNKEKSFEEIWKELYEYDVSEYVDTKGMGWGDAEYLSWGVTHTILMELFGSNYSWKRKMIGDMPYRLLDNGTGEVETTITIHGYERDFFLPIMDFKGDSTRNLDAKTVNNNIMRCFVKNASVNFGLGMRLFSQLKEDTKNQGDEPEPQQGENITPDKVKAKKEKAIDDLELQIESGVNEAIEDTPSLESKCNKFIEVSEVYLKTVKTVQECEDFYPNNKENFVELKKVLPQGYEGLIKMFKNKKLELQKKGEK